MLFFICFINKPLNLNWQTSPGVDKQVSFENNQAAELLTRIRTACSLYLVKTGSKSLQQKEDMGLLEEWTHGRPEIIKRTGTPLL